MRFDGGCYRKVSYMTVKNDVKSRIDRKKKRWCLNDMTKLLSFVRNRFSDFLFYRKIKGFYLKIQGTYFKIYALCFEIYGLCFLRCPHARRNTCRIGARSRHYFLRMYAKVCGVCHLEGLVPFVMPKVLSISLRMFVKGRSMCSVVFRVSVTL